MWIQLHARATLDHLGLILSFFSEDDPRPATEQIYDAYCGGWMPLKGFKRSEDGRLSYADDPPLIPLFMTMVHDDIITVYDSAWVCVTRPDGSFEVARLD